MVLSQRQMQLLRQLYHASFLDPTADLGLLKEAQAKHRAWLQRLKEQLQRHLSKAESSNGGPSTDTLNGLCHEVGPINNPQATSGVDLQADSGYSFKSVHRRTQSTEIPTLELIWETTLSIPWSPMAKSPPSAKSVSRSHSPTSQGGAVRSQADP
ncbi:unnamed protein product [Ixodes persulcatus]